MGEGSSYPWLRLMAGWQVLISLDSRILRRHVLSSRAITLTSSILMGCSWSPTAVRGDFCFRWSFILVSRVREVSPTYCAGHSGHWVSLTTPYFFMIRCLVFGVDQDGAQGVEGLVVSPDFMFFFNSEMMYLWYMVGLRWCGPGPLWCYERCRACFWVGVLKAHSL